MLVAVVQEVVSIEAEEKPHRLHPSFARQVHAPMERLVRAVIEGDNRPSDERDCPGAQEHTADEKWQSGDCDKEGAIPPRHGDCVFVLFVLEVVRVVVPQNTVVRLRMFFKRVVEDSEKRAMHKILMQGPFEE